MARINSLEWNQTIFAFNHFLFKISSLNSLYFLTFYYKKMFWKNKGKNCGCQIFYFPVLASTGNMTNEWIENSQTFCNIERYRTCRMFASFLFVYESPYSLMYSPSLLDSILPHVQTFQEYALACLGSCTVHPNMQY